MDETFENYKDNGSGLMVPAKPDLIDLTGQKMTRRGFTAGMMGSALAAPALLSPNLAEANQDDGVAELLATALVGTLLIAASSRNPILIKQIIFLMAANFYVLTLRAAQKLTLEGSLSPSKQASTILATMSVIGQLYVLGSVLFVLAGRFQPSARNAQVIIPGGSDQGPASIRKNMRLKPRKNAKVPSVAQVRKQGRRVGDASANANGSAMVLKARDAAFKT